MKCFKKGLGIILFIAMVTQIFCVFPAFSFAAETKAIDKYLYEPGSITITGTKQEVTFENNKKGATNLTWRNPESADLTEVKIYRIADNGYETDMTSSATAYKYSVNQQGYVALATPGAIGKLTELHDTKDAEVKYRLIFKFRDGTVKDIVYAGKASTGQTGYVFLGTKSLSKTENGTLNEYAGHGDFWATDAYGPQGSYTTTVNGVATTVTNTSTMKSVGLPLMTSSVVKNGKTALKFSSNEWAYDVSGTENGTDIWSKNSTGNPTNVMGGVADGIITQNNDYYISMQINTVESFKFSICGTEVTIPNTNGEWQLFETKFKWRCPAVQFNLQRVWPDIFRDFYIDDVEIYQDSTKAKKLWSEDYEMKDYSLHTAPRVKATYGADSAEISWSNVDGGDIYVNVYEKMSDGTLALRARVKEGDKSIKFNNLVTDQTYTYVVKSAKGDDGSGRGLESEAATVTVTPHIEKRGTEYEPGDIMVTGWKAGATYDGYNGYSMLSWKNPTSDKLSDVKIYRINSDKTETDVTASAKAHYGRESAYSSISRAGAVGRYWEGQSSASGTVSYRLVFKFSDGEERNVIYSDQFKEEKGTLVIPTDGDKIGISQYGSGSYGPADASGSTWSMGPVGKMVPSTEEPYAGKASLKIVTNTWPMNYNGSAWTSMSGEQVFGILNMPGGVAGQTYVIKMAVKTYEECYLRIGGTENLGTACKMPNTNGEWQEVKYSFELSTDDRLYIDTMGSMGEVRGMYIDNIRVYDSEGREPFYTEDFERSAYSPTLKSAPAGLAVSESGGEATITWTSADYEFVNIYEALTTGDYVLRARVPKDDKSVVISGLEENKTHTFYVKCARKGNSSNPLIEGEGAFIPNSGIRNTSIDYKYTDEYEPRDVLITGWNGEATYGDGIAGYSVLSWKNPTSDKLSDVKIYRINSDKSETDVTASAKAHYGNESKFTDINTPDAIGRYWEAQTEARGSVKYRLVFSFTDGEVRSIVYGDKYQPGCGVAVLNTEGERTGASQFGFTCPGPSGTVSGSESRRTLASTGQTGISSAEVYEGNASLRLVSNSWGRETFDDGKTWEAYTGNFVNCEFGSVLTAGAQYTVKMMINSTEACRLRFSSGGTTVDVPNTNGEWQEAEYTFTAVNNRFDIRTVGEDGGHAAVYIDNVDVRDADNNSVYTEDFERTSYTASLKNAPQGVSAAENDGKVTVSWTSAEQTYVNVYEVSDGHGILRARVPKSDLSVDLSNLKYNKRHRLVVKSSAPATNDGFYPMYESGGAETSVLIEKEAEFNYVFNDEYEPRDILVTGYYSGAAFDGYAGYSVLSWKNPTSAKLSEVKIYSIATNGTETDVTSDAYAHIGSETKYTSINTPNAVGRYWEGKSAAMDNAKYRLVFKFSDGEERNIIYSDTYKADCNVVIVSAGDGKNAVSQFGHMTYGPKATVDGKTNYKTLASIGLMSVTSSTAYEGNASLKIMSNAWKYEPLTTSGPWNINNVNFVNYYASKVLTAGNTYTAEMMVKTMRNTSLRFGLYGTVVDVPNTNGQWVKQTYSFKAASEVFDIRTVLEAAEQDTVYVDNIVVKDSGGNVVYSEDFERTNVTNPLGKTPLGLSVTEGDGCVDIKWDSATYNFVNVYAVDDKGNAALRARVPKGNKKVRIQGLKNGKKYTFVVKGSNSGISPYPILESDPVVLEGTPYKRDDSLVVSAEKKYAELKALLKACNNKGVYPDYEKSDVEIVRIFTERMRDEYNKGTYENLDKYASETDVIYNEVKGTLEDFIAGRAMPVKALDGDGVASVTVENGNVYTTNENGVKKPSVRVGFCAFNSSDEDLADFNELGLNTIQLDGLGLGPTHLLNYNESTHEFEKSSGAEAGLDIARSTLQLCREKGIVVAASLPIHYFNEYVPKMDGAEDMRSDGGSYGTFMNYNPTAPTSKKMLSKYFEVYVPLFYEYRDVIASITFVNEPYIELYDKSFYFDQWTEFLKKHYSNIDELNAAYNSEYTSFDDVKMPHGVPGRDKGDSSGVYSTRLHVDYRLFVSDVMYEFFDFCVSEINKHTNGEIPCGAKTMQFFREYASMVDNLYARYISYDYENVVSLLGVNEMDSFTSYGNTGITIPAKLSWYDFTTSMKNVPIVDTETHVSSDEEVSGGSLTIGNELNTHVAASVWMGAIHGCDMTETWLYAHNDAASPYYGASFGRNPLSLRMLSEESLDIQRLDDEITAFQDQKRETAILYSYDCFLLNIQYEANKTRAYEMITNSGQKPLFVTENSLDKLDDVKVLVIPGNMIVADANTVDKITQFADNGGKVVILGDKTFSRDKNNNEITDSALLNKIAALKSKSTVVSSKLEDNVNKTAFNGTEKNKIEEVLSSAGLLDVKLVDKATGKVADVEWNAVEYGDDILLQACNYSGDDVTVKVYKNGEALSGVDDIKNTEYGLSEICLKTNEPVMLKLSDYEMTYSLTDGEGACAAKIGEGGYKAAVTVRNNYRTDGVDAVLVAALYKDGALYYIDKSESVKIAKGESKELAVENIINVPNVSDGEYTLKLMLWSDFDTLKPLGEAKCFGE